MSPCSCVHKSHNNDSAVSPGARYGNKKTETAAGCRQRGYLWWSTVGRSWQSRASPHTTALHPTPALHTFQESWTLRAERSGVSQRVQGGETQCKVSFSMLGRQDKHTGHSTRVHTNTKQQPSHASYVSLSMKQLNSFLSQPAHFIHSTFLPHDNCPIQLVEMPNDNGLKMIRRTCSIVSHCQPTECFWINNHNSVNLKAVLLYC